ncbi:VWA domain-containing protein [Verrucomicrobiaceae bacterium N1E253]|uniref:VWA domain-containing protein n=1 Tax=Oceaniferula marina TaxID=2748318 RepID=A0A851G9C7_9BACT|nr:VWA domain-containing protein [Oceaniferula marina]NWK54213.1 VWA domain-containing protein [Oceaniferula marina]
MNWQNSEWWFPTAFSSPQWFWLLLLLPIIAFYQRRLRRQDAIVYSSVALFGEHVKTWRQYLLFIPPLCLHLALICLIACLARPQIESTGTRQDREGIAIQMLVDVSSSMDMDIQTPDGPMTRMEVAKKVMEQFVIGDGDSLSGRPDDTIGVVSFARYSDSICPMTLGHDALVHIIRELTINDRPNEDGTAYGDATALAAAQLKQQDREDGAMKSKVILLLTDGENNCGTQMPLQAASMAKEWGIRIYTISLQETAKPKMIQTDAGKFFRPDTRSESDRVLEKMASSTGGVFRTAHDMDSLQSVYKEINTLEKTKLEEVDYIEYDEAFTFYALSALLLLLVRYALSSTILRISP